MSIIEKALKKSGKQGSDNANAANLGNDSALKAPVKKNSIESAFERFGKQDLIANGSNNSRSAPINGPENILEKQINANVEADKVSKKVRTVAENKVDINWAKLSAEGYLDNNNARSKIAEEFRFIKRPLVNNIQSAKSNRIERPNLILITSSEANEGKTFIAINLALSIANEREKNVLLIDANVESPSISEKMGIKQAPGLIEYLEDDNIRFSDIILKTDLANLSVIPAGKRHKYSTELLSSEKMYSFAEEVSKRYRDRVVIFDSPPLLASTHAQILVDLVGQVVLVIASDSTRQNKVAESIAKLENCDVVMTILNKVSNDSDSNGNGNDDV